MNKSRNFGLTANVRLKKYINILDGRWRKADHKINYSHFSNLLAIKFSPQIINYVLLSFPHNGNQFEFNRCAARTSNFCECLWSVVGHSLSTTQKWLCERGLHIVFEFEMVGMRLWGFMISSNGGLLNELNEVIAHELSKRYFKLNAQYF